MTETLAYNGYSSESTLRELPNECQHEGFSKTLRPSPLEKCSLRVGRVKCATLSAVKILSTFTTVCLSLAQITCVGLL